MNRISLEKESVLRKKRCNKKDEIQEPQETLEIKETEKVQKRPIRKKKQDLINSKETKDDTMEIDSPLVINQESNSIIESSVLEINSYSLKNTRKSTKTSKMVSMDVSKDVSQDVSQEEYKEELVETKKKSKSIKKTSKKQELEIILDSCLSNFEESCIADEPKELKELKESKESK